MSSLVQGPPYWPFGHIYVPGRYYWGQFGSLRTGNFGTGEDFIHYCPLWVPRRQAFDRIVFEVTTAAAAGGLARLGCYTHNWTTVKPNQLVFDAGTVATTSTGAKEITIAQTLSQGLYWLCIVCNLDCTVRQHTTNSHCGQLNWGCDTPDPASGANIMIGRYNGTLTFGVLPATAPNPADFGNANSAVRIGLRAA